MGDVCGDNRFEIIKKAKEDLLMSTNIETSQDEMKVIDTFLFRCGQMGWLERYDKPRGPLDIPTMTTEFIKEHGLPCPNGYIFKDENGNVIEAKKIVLEKKKKEYPKSLEECVKYIKSVKEARDRAALLCKMEKLLVCREAYWKIAGEEMGLGKSWEPRWNDSYQKKWIINFYQDEINLTNGSNVHFVLTFPTEEMRDAFYENFKEEIEQCKELL